MTDIDPAPRRAAPTASRGRVLLVEDDAPSRAGLCALLTQQIPGARMDEVERYVILKTLEHTSGSTTQAAEILGLSVRTIQYRLQSYQMSSRRGRGPRVGLFGPKGPSPSSERRSSG